MSTAVITSPLAHPTPRAGASPRQARQPIRLNRRGRLVFGVLAVLGFAVLFLLASTAISAALSPVAHAGTAAEAVKVSHVTVRSGESLWSIASTAAPDSDPRDTVAQIIELNDLPSSTVQAGQTLIVPVYR